jgi:hypothetical protein
VQRPLGISSEDQIGIDPLGDQGVNAMIILK